ncbi:unnamed protein product [Merluccius merluccius]
MDTGRKRGHGRVVLIYFDLCEAIWGATNVSITEGVETGDVAVDAAGSEDAASDTASAEVATKRRLRRDAIQSGCKKSKQKRNLSMAAIAQEELDIKRRLLQQLEETDREFLQTMGRWSSSWSSTMDRLNSNIELLVKHIAGSDMTSVSPILIKIEQHD